jgi:hypothetical protein
MRRIKLLIILGALLFTVQSVASAYHQGQYFAEDPSKQVPVQGTENWAFKSWAISQSSLWWWSDSPLRSEVLNAISNWNSAVSELV